MSYDYFCTNCAKKVNNKTVLFDMQSMLTGSTSIKFQILKFRMTEDQLLTLYGKDLCADGGRKSCTLTFQQIMSIIANSNNLNDPVIAELTPGEVEAFLNADLSAALKKNGGKVHDPDDLDDDLNDDLDDELEDESEDQEKTEAEVKTPSAIEALLSKETSLSHEAFARGMLKDDLQKLWNVFLAYSTAKSSVGISSEDCLNFQLILNSDPDDRGHLVLNGATVAYRNSTLPMDNNRICPHCGERIFPLAGTALHKSVVFIGYRGSGKTSTLLAMTHYALNHMQFDIGDSAWVGATSLKGIKEIRLLAPPQKLQKELEDFGKGIAPEKTNVEKRDDAYSATLLLKTEVGKNQFVARILTLMDLPGDICELGGTIDKAKIYDTFTVATVCDAFVTCMDTTIVEMAAQGNESIVMDVKDNSGQIVHLTPSMMIRDTCSWADEFQKMLVLNQHTSMYIPNMLLFTKCRSMEAGEDDSIQTHGVQMHPANLTYMFRSEQQAIQKNCKYSVACEQFNSIGDLSNSYHAMLRCSPYGYAAPDAKMAKEKTCHTPTPINIDRLMRWLLMVMGCLPIDAIYYPTMADYLQGRSGENLHRDDYLISRPQHRQQNPLRGQEVAEALARCYLFENPGQHDMEFLGFYNQKLRLLASIALAKKDSNAEKLNKED